MRCSGPQQAARTIGFWAATLMIAASACSQTPEPAGSQPSAPADHAPAIPQRLADEIAHVDLQGVTVRQALSWWSDVTKIPLRFDDDAAQQDGLDVDRLVTLRVSFVPASQVLKEILQTAATDQQRFIAEITPWYLKLQSRKQANRQLTLRVYLISDFLLEVPHFPAPPSMNLSTALSGSGRSGSSNLYTTTTTETLNRASPQERAQKLKELIQQMVEPDVWDASGGESTIAIFQNQLVVKAPKYVHDQIGPSVPVGSP